MKKLLMVSIVSLVVFNCLSVTATDSPERMYRSYDVFAGSIDKLLLETPHVYIKATHESGFYYMPEFGLIYNADISMTMSGGLPKIVEQWSDWFSGVSGSSIVINKRKDGNATVRLQPDDSDESAKPEESSEKAKDIQAADKIRLETMSESIAAFKIEVMELILDFAPIVKVQDHNDYLVIVFKVAEPQFFEQYSTNSLQVRIRFKDLMELPGKNLQDPKNLKFFHWNV